MNESTKKLVAALVEANSTGELDEIISEARNEHFHDYHENGYTFPQMTLAEMLRRKTGTGELCQRVIDGEFDATTEEANAWLSSPEGQEAIEAFRKTSQHNG